MKTDESPYMSVPEAAAFCRVSVWTVRAWLSAGRLPRQKAGGRTLIARADVQALVRRETPQEAAARNVARERRRG